MANDQFFNQTMHTSSREYLFQMAASDYKQIT